MSYVTDIPPALPEIARDHFLRRLSVETDCSDVAATLRGGEPDFVLLHVVGSPQAYERRHMPGALHLPHRDISAGRMGEWPSGTLFVVYCAGPHCNGADRAAFKLASLGLPVKIMIGGISGWQDEDLPFASGKEPGVLRP
ncbi:MULTISPECIES: rhodanese-like domain-containing protein [unclassified Mesorhizobium]|uniref:rhodanese-like domain-containing protein n=1 Tax=unclassified Mesorhizobium TaxID=325217 RepID=UPI000F74F041|nr:MULTISPECIES: rhodanese-like domain-containing protein [unclassified Mesorhizobium]AZO52600.1 rhodanese-like domain-containing protein [Mesorhizobium sp. M8A.F.Ca.ET.057.01.1.1]RWE45564.1 MAG: rhodanese-like domain-containing protein [Mesorhizobium sp.]